MRLNFSLFFILFVLLCKPVYADDCKSFQNELDIQNKAMEYIDCSIKSEKQGVPVEVTYRFKGNDALKVEGYLINKFDINPIEREPGIPYWRSYKSYLPKRNLQIIISTEDNLDDFSRDDWKNIDYFYIQFSKYTEDI